MRVLPALALVVLVSACPPRPTEPTGDATSVAAGDAGAAPAAREPVTDCAGEPAWMASAPCRADRAVFARGHATGTNLLARANAVNQARAALVELGLGEQQDGGAVTLRGTEVLDTFVCEPQTYALVRTTAESELAADLTDCSGAAFEPVEVPDAACPVWTRRVAWRVGDDVVAVGAVSGMKNRALAAQTARNRAMAEAQRVAEVTLTVEQNSVSSRTDATAPGVPTDLATAECDGTLYARVTYAQP